MGENPQKVNYRKFNKLLLNSFWQNHSRKTPENLKFTRISKAMATVTISDKNGKLLRKPQKQYYGKGFYFLLLF